MVDVRVRSVDSCGCFQGDPRAGRGAGGQVMMEVESGQSARKGPVTGERIGRTMTPQSAQVHDALHAIESTLVRPGARWELSEVCEIME